MRVFKACLLVIKRRMVTFATYFAIFIGLSILLSQFSKAFSYTHLRAHET